MTLWPRNPGKASVLLPWERRRGWLTGGTPLARHAVLIGAGIGICLLLMWALRVQERRARVRATRTTITEVQRAIAAFRAEFGRCPEFPGELLHPPRAAARYLTEVPQDAWGHKLYVSCPSSHDPSAAEVVSAGPSGSFSDGDNIY